MPLAKTDKQVEAEVLALREAKPHITRINGFGEDNHSAIEVQIEVLEKRMSMDAVFERWGNEAHPDFKRHLLDQAIYACDWVCGDLADDEESPATGWTALA